MRELIVKDEGFPVIKSILKSAIYGFRGRITKALKEKNKKA